VESIRTKFDPQKHGFQFENRFGLADFLKIDLPIDLSFFRQGSQLGRVVYGLCGGMCCAALDFYYANNSIPVGYADPDEIPYRLFSYLWHRQMDSLKPPVLGNVIKWMVLDDKIVLQQTGKEEIPKLLQELRSGNPTVLILIRSAISGDPTQNHQVLATGFDYDLDNKELKIYLYDPNHPKGTGELLIKLAAPGRRMAITQKGEKAPRGIFVGVYTPQNPV
jgi:hypothetical protein